jgi:hypothetical protein
MMPGYMRDRVVDDLCQRGATLAEIGRTVGLTRERVRQILTAEQAQLRKQNRCDRLREAEFWRWIEKIRGNDRGRSKMALVVRLQSQCGLPVRWRPDGSVELHGVDLRIVFPKSCFSAGPAAPHLRYYRVTHSARYWYVDVLPDGRAYLHDPVKSRRHVYYREDRVEMRRRHGLQARLLWADNVRRAA